MSGIDDWMKTPDWFKRWEDQAWPGAVKESPPIELPDDFTEWVLEVQRQKRDMG